MLHRTYSPDDFNTHCMLRLPWAFWLVLILQAKTWFLFVVAGSSRQQGADLLALFYPDRGLFWSGMLVGLPAALGFLLSGRRHLWKGLWKSWRWVLILTTLAQMGLQAVPFWTNSNDVTLLSLVILLLDLLAVAYLLFNSRLIDSFKISESFKPEA